MAKIVRYNGNLQAFASAALGTERTIFGDVTQANDLTSQVNADFLRGWGIVGPSDQPALEDFNGAMYTHGQLLAYLHQIGVAEYNATQEYHLGSFCNESGLLYSSLINSNVGNTPSSSPASWHTEGTGQLVGVQTFAANGTFTPNSRTKSIVVEAVGAGGGGGGTAITAAGQVAAAYGGTAGTYAKSRYTTGFSGASVLVGSGGAGATAGNNPGSAGGATSFGALLSCPGGVGGIGGPANAAANSFAISNPPSLAASGANITQVLGGGSLGPFTLSTAQSISGEGGTGFFGVGARPRQGGAGFAADNPGTGGSGAAVSVSSGVAQAGGAGANGLVIVWEYS